MSALDTVLKLLGIDGAALLRLFNAIADFLKGFFDRETRFLTSILNIGDAVTTAKQQIEDFKHFKPDLAKFKSRVISAPQAVTFILGLKDDLVEIFGERLSKIESEIKVFANSLEPQRVPSGGAEEDAGNVANTVVKIDAWLETLNRLSDLLKELLDFTQAIDNVKTKVENLDGLFLSQGRSRETWYLAKQASAGAKPTFKRVG